MSGGRELVLSTLRQATSQNAEELKPAEKQLHDWEIEPGFYTTLIEIFSEHNLEVNVRWLAILYFKNGVDRYWRKTAPQAIGEPEKANIRRGLLQNLREPVPQIAIQVAVLIGKLARVDCPNEWPELLPALFDAVRHEDSVIQHRTLLTLYHVVKQLSSKRLAHDRRTFQDLTSKMLNFMLELWGIQTNRFLALATSEGSSSANMALSLERSLLALKILRKLVIHGFKKPHENREVMGFMEAVFERIKIMINFRKEHENVTTVKDISEKYIVHLTKVLHDMHENFPFSYLDFIKPSLDLTVYYIFTPAGDGIIFERFVIQCLNLMKALIMCPEYKPCKVLEETKQPDTLKAYTLKKEFFTDSVLTAICHKLISHYFLLTQEDLEIWDSDPEGFCMEVDGGESWKYGIRPCTETLFLALFHEYRVALTPVIMELVALSQNPVNPGDYRGILHKDAIYNSVGLAAFELFDEIEFDSWFTNILINEIKVKDSNYRIIRRRVIWLIGQWSGVKFATDNRPALYEICINLMSPEEDFVVRLTAAMTLKNAVDDFEFDPDQFMPYLPTIFGLLFNLLKQAFECDTKMQVLHVMSFMTEVVGVGIQPHAAPLAQYLPGLWEESADHNMLRCAILTTLVHMVVGLMRESELLHDFLIKIISVSTDVKEQCHVYLLEDGLGLWQATLENTSQASQPLLQLYRNILPLIEMSTENLRLCLQITNAYIILCPQVFLTQYGSAIIQTYMSIITDLKSEGLVVVLRSVEVMLRAMPNEAPILLQPMLSGFVKAVISEDHYPLIVSMYLSLLSRLVLYSYDTFTWAVTKAGEESNTTAEETLSQLLRVWSEKLALVSPDERRKLCGLALAQLCSSPWTPILNIWPAAMTSVAEVIFDLTMDDSDEDKLVMGNGCGDRMGLESPVVFEHENEHFKRKQILAQSDPVHTTSLRVFLGQKLHDFHRASEPSTLASLYENLEHDCKKLLQEITCTL